MKKIFVFLILIYYAANLYAADDNLYEQFKGCRTIKIFLEDVVNETKNPDVKIDLFRNVFKETIEKRTGIKFIYSGDKKNADLAITVRIKDYTFTENAMPMVFSTATLVADSLSPKSSGKLTADYEIRRTKDDKILLYYKNFATEERRPKEDMKGEFGFINSVAKSVNRFIHKAFYKPKCE